MQKNNTTAGALLTILSALAYAVLGLIVKTKVTEVNTLLIIMVQSIVTLLLILPVVIQQKAWPTIKSSPFKLTHLLRSIASMGISLFLFLALKNVPLVNALTLLNTAPLITPLIAFLLLGQPFNHKLWLPMALGLTGVIIILQPNFHNFNWHNLLALAGACCMVLSTVLTKKTSGHDNGLVICFYYFLFSSIISSIVAIFVWHPISLQILSWLILIGILFFITQYALSVALRAIAPEIALTLYYSNIIFAAILGVIFMHHHLSFDAILGIILASASGIACILLQNKKRLPS